MQTVKLLHSSAALEVIVARAQHRAGQPGLAHITSLGKHIERKKKKLHTHTRVVGRDGGRWREGEKVGEKVIGRV